MVDVLARPGFLAQVEQRDQELLAGVTQGEVYGVHLASVQEIVVPPPLTPVPRSPRAVMGICSVRGRLVTVVDFRSCLGLPPLDGARRGRILLSASEDDDIVGLRVDEVRHVVRLASNEIELTSQTLGGDNADAVRGVGRPKGGQELVLIDLRAVLRKGCS